MLVFLNQKINYIKIYKDNYKLDDSSVYRPNDSLECRPDYRSEYRIYFKTENSPDYRPDYN